MWGEKVAVWSDVLKIHKLSCEYIFKFLKAIKCVSHTVKYNRSSVLSVS